MVEVATIERTYQRAKAEGLGISKHFIRQACLNGTLKHCRSGAKILIYYPNLITLLQEGMPNTESSTVDTKIIPITGINF